MKILSGNVNENLNQDLKKFFASILSKKFH